MQTSPTLVLVIEKHPIMREALCTAIASESDMTVAAPSVNGSEAIQMLGTLSPDIILFTLSNNGQDGLETLRLLRESLPAIPILALTSNDVAGQEQAALEAGANRVLTKAAPRADLIRALNDVWTQANVNHSETHPEKNVNGRKPG